MDIIQLIITDFCVVGQSYYLSASEITTLMYGTSDSLAKPG